MRIVLASVALFILFLSGCSNEGQIDLTIYNKGFQGITYTDAEGNIIGPVDYDDWRLGYGKYIVESPGKGALAAKILPEHFDVAAAYPNPTSSTITFSVAAPIYIEYRIQIVNDDYYIFKEYTGVSEAGVTEYVIELRDKNDDPLPDGIYRVLYQFNEFGGYGDVWVMNNPVDIF